jgi:pimeloyl-ACP methyl ester carboxylesterase
MAGEAAAMSNAQPAKRRAISRDGTEIAYWTSGAGPPLVLVHGVAADHSRWAPLLPYLEPHVSVQAMDRRGRGASGDGGGYALEREAEDVAAVVDAVAKAHASLVDVYGHSHGGFCAFGAAALTANVRRLALYEGWPIPDPDVLALPAALDEAMEALLAAGDRGGAIEALFRGLLEMTDDDIAAFKAAPSWAGRVAAAHTIGREVRAEARTRLDPELAARITIPVALITGTDSADPVTSGIEAVVAALPDARIVSLQNQGHVADVLAPEMFADRLLAWLRDGR